MRPEPRAEFLVVPLSEHELAFIREGAAGWRMEPSDFLRMAALDEAFRTSRRCREAASRNTDTDTNEKEKESE